MAAGFGGKKKHRLNRTLYRKRRKMRNKKKKR